jgi:spore germination protein YaaH
MKVMNYIRALFVIVPLLLPISASAATNSNSFEVTGWIPYWRTATGTADVLPHLNLVTEINPFVYSLRSDGTIVDNAPLTDPQWVNLMTAAKQQKVRVIPTIMSGSGSLLHTLLTSASERIALESRITSLVKTNNFDGIDIDFEGKYAGDKNYFSTFLKGLYQRMGQKYVMCTIESRTPVDSRYYGTNPPADATVYANDLTAINKYCDRVRIMTYDQQTVDQALAATAASSSELYAPVADPRWVIKVVNLMAQSIKKSKMLIGIPTYGYEYDVTAYTNNQYNYDIMWTFNPGYALPLAAQYGITPQRNQAGEMFFTYSPVGTSSGPTQGVSALMAATAATAYADSANMHMDFRLVDWPDAQSIAGKIELAQMLGVRGVSIFKLDGGEDPAIWTALLGVKS